MRARLDRFSRRHPDALLALLLLALTLVFLERVLFPPAGKMILGLDARALTLTWLTTARQSILSGHLPLWDVSQGSGYPFIANPQVALFYPPTWLAILLPVRYGLSWYVVLHVWLGALGMLLFVRTTSCTGRSTWLGPLLAALTFGFSGFVAARISAGHLGVVAALLWTPWLMLATVWSVTRRDIWSAIVGGVPLALSILAGHSPSVIYVGIVWLAFSIYLMASGEHWLLVARQVVVMGTVGLLLSAVQLLPTAQLILQAQKSVLGNAGEWSMPPAQLITLLVPGFFGDIKLGYWGAPGFEELTYYAGVLPLLGMALAIRKPNRRTWLYVALIVFGLLTALGRYGFLYQLLYDVIPLFRLIRAPGRAMFLFSFAASALLGDAVSAWEDRSREDREALSVFLRRAMLVIAGLGVAGVMGGGIALAATGGGDHALAELGGWALAVGLLLLGAALLGYYFTAAPEDTSRRRWLMAGLAGLAVVDLWLFGFKLIDLSGTQPLPVWRDAHQIIGQSDQRVVAINIQSLFYQNDSTLVGLLSTGGYIPVPLASHESLLGYQPGPLSRAYDILGAAYVLSPTEVDPAFTQGVGALELMQSTGQAWVYRRPTALPMVRLVYSAEVIPTASAALDRLFVPGFDPANTAIVDSTPGCELGGAPQQPGSAHVLAQRPGSWLIETDSPAPALLVIGETAYPGWQVTVDGQRVQPLVAYTAVKAVCVPAGTHRVQWTFVPPLLLGGAASLIGLALLAVAAVMGFRERTVARTARAVEER